MRSQLSLNNFWRANLQFTKYTHVLQNIINQFHNATTI